MMPNQDDASRWLSEDHASLAQHNSLRVAARARRLLTVHDASALPELLSQAPVTDGRVLILGKGSNVVFTGDY
ncbi:MAG: hypothetical protein L0H70_09805, partial [Xanthomonadales bacterium]|nr:hypothetical protein [Xanthomonadales bacterium]